MLEHVEEWVSTVKMERASIKGLFLSTLMLFIGACPIKIKLKEIAQNRIMEWIRSNDASYTQALIRFTALTILFAILILLAILFAIINKFYGEVWAFLSCGVVIGLGYLLSIKTKGDKPD